MIAIEHCLHYNTSELPTKKKWFINSSLTHSHGIFLCDTATRVSVHSTFFRQVTIVTVYLYLGLLGANFYMKL